jgi:hypothetical protein
MAKYAPGQNEDKIIKTTEEDKTLDLSVFIAKFVELKDALQKLPSLKTTPDQETLDYWVAFAYQEGQDTKDSLDAQAVELYNEITAIKNADLLPSKYDDEYQQLETYINNL